MKLATKVSIFSGFAVSTGTLLALAGCGSNPSTSPARTVSGAISPDGHMRAGWPDSRGNPLVFIADYEANAVMIYTTAGGSPVGSIASGMNEPLGLWIDSNGTLYVANYGSNNITEYQRGSTSPSKTLTGVTYPRSVATDRMGNVYVVGYSPGAVWAFAGGSSTPTTNVSLAFAEGVAVGGKQNVYVTYNDSGGNGHCEKFEPGLRGRRDLGITMGESGDAQVDRSGNRVLGDQLHRAINVYAPGTVSPKGTIDVTPYSPWSFALDKGGKNLYVQEGTTVVVYAYPSGSVERTTFPGLRTASGVAVGP